MNDISYSQKINSFQGRMAPEEGILVGYGAVIEALKLKVPLPKTLSLISLKNKQEKIEGWNIYSSKIQPEDSLYKHLVFSIKYEGINLLFFKKLFLKISEDDIYSLIRNSPTGIYSRKIWFLYEWLMNLKLNIDDLDIKNFVPLLDEKLQYTVEGKRSARHRIINNLPGTVNFCPLINRTLKLDNFILENLSAKQNSYFTSVGKEILQRASAFLLLKDSKASFTIEKEKPSTDRATRWGHAIGQAGTKSFSKEEFLRLQQIVIESDRFLNMGYRKEGGFVGEHDRETGNPIPDHISARWQDVEQLVDGLIATADLHKNSMFDAVLVAALIAFGFVFIHPFEDGNGRIHRYLIHHILAEKNFAKQGIIFPVSSSILNQIDVYRKVLESYSQPLLNFIEWKETAKHNVEVLNETIDYYRYFDATLMAEFLYDCVQDTMKNIIPQEIAYLSKYDEMKRYLDDHFEMPDSTISMLIRFLEQNNGVLSNRAKSREFNALNPDEVKKIEKVYQEIFVETEK